MRSSGTASFARRIAAGAWEHGVGLGTVTALFPRDATDCGAPVGRVPSPCTLQQTRRQRQHDQSANTSSGADRQRAPQPGIRRCQGPDESGSQADRRPANGGQDDGCGDVGRTTPRPHCDWFQGRLVCRPESGGRRCRLAGCDHGLGDCSELRSLATTGNASTAACGDGHCGFCYGHPDSQADTHSDMDVRADDYSDVDARAHVASDHDRD